jgi:3-oxoacyl-[acyl-carrier-protein] synthase III
MSTNVRTQAAPVAELARSSSSPLLRAMLAGTGRCLPDQVVRNEDFPPSLETSDEWIRTRTGIRERRIAGPEENTFTLGVKASRAALEAAALGPEDVDLIVCATVTPHTMVPSNACRIQAALGCRPIPAFDLSGACTGFLHALAVANQFLATGACRNVLIVGSDVLSRTLDFSDRATCILFGDGAGAAVLSGTENPERGVRWLQLYSDGARGELIHMHSHVTHVRPPLSGASDEAPFRDFTRLNGREVYRFAVRTLVSLVQDALAACPLPDNERLFLVPHQVNGRIIDAALQELPLKPEQVMLNLDRYGNTSAASVPIALDESLRSSVIRRGDHVLLAAFGGGLTWGGALITV